MANGNHKVVYMIEERGGKSYWNRIGVAFVNRDGSLSVNLSAIPIPTISYDKDDCITGMSYKLQIRDNYSQDSGGGQRRGGGGRRQQQRQEEPGEEDYSQDEEQGGDVPW